MYEVIDLFGQPIVKSSNEKITDPLTTAAMISANIAQL